jgi:flagellin-like protein
MKMLRSRKALSPVVASIILIAVTVAVSIAVAAWMGALTFNFMATEQGQLTNLQFSTSPGSILITFNNTGTSAITVNEVWVNGIKKTTFTSGTIPYSVPANQGYMWNVTTTVVSGYQYSVTLVSAKGNKFTSTGTAPS